MYFVIAAILIVFGLFRIRHDRYSPGIPDEIVVVDGNKWPSESSPQSPDSLLLSSDSLGQTGGDEHLSTGQMPDKAPPKPHEAEDDKRRPSFYEIAMDKGTDKVTMHTYQDTYERYLPSRSRSGAGGRGGKVRLLELGLGCEAGHGAAAALSSYHTWREYFPGDGLELYFIEADAECAGKWRSEMNSGGGGGGGTTVVAAGDPGDAAFLDGFLQEHGGDFDVVVGGGGHTVEQQMTSLETLWKAVRPGGVYFCEYLETSYLERYGGGVPAKKPTMRDTMVHFLHDMIEDLMYPEPNVDAYHLKDMDISWPRKVQFDEVESISHIDCSRQICAIMKRAD